MNLSYPRVSHNLQDSFMVICTISYANYTTCCCAVVHFWYPRWNFNPCDNQSLYLLYTYDTWLLYMYVQSLTLRLGYSTWKEYFNSHKTLASRNSLFQTLTLTQFAYVACSCAPFRVVIDLWMAFFGQSAGLVSYCKNRRHWAKRGWDWLWCKVRLWVTAMFMSWTEKTGDHFRSGIPSPERFQHVFHIFFGERHYFLRKAMPAPHVNTSVRQNLMTV